MNFCGIHICQDEIQGFLMAVPFAGAAWVWLRTKLRRTG